MVLGDQRCEVSIYAFIHPLSLSYSRSDSVGKCVEASMGIYPVTGEQFVLKVDVQESKKYI